MSYYTWDPALETGFETVDEQHRSLFALANQLQRTIDSHLNDSDAVADAVYGLVGYVVEHFADEERIMAQYGYPGLVPHRSLHEQLNATTLDIVTRYTNGDDMRPDSLAPVVCEWLTNHIEQHDKSFVAYLRRVEAERATPAGSSVAASQ